MTKKAKHATTTPKDLPYKPHPTNTKTLNLPFTRAKTIRDGKETVGTKMKRQETTFYSAENRGAHASGVPCLASRQTPCSPVHFPHPCPAPNFSPVFCGFLRFSPPSFFHKNHPFPPHFLDFPQKNLEKMTQKSRQITMNDSGPRNLELGPPFSPSSFCILPSAFL